MHFDPNPKPWLFTRLPTVARCGIKNGTHDRVVVGCLVVIAGDGMTTITTEENA